MGNYMLCRRPLASVPFHIESIHLNIYSIEELCYFLSSNLALAEEVTLDPVLSLWLSDECGLTDKIREYEALAADDPTGGRRLYWIFARSHYFSEAQMKQLKIRIEQLDEMTPARRGKARGDALIRNGKYLCCIQCYEQVLDGETQEAEADFTADIWYTMGCAYARLFQGARAAECFSKAFETAPSQAFRDAYLKAVYFEGGGEHLKEAGRALKLSADELEAIHEEIAQVRGKPLSSDPDKMLASWIRAYHDSVDQ